MYSILSPILLLCRHTGNVTYSNNGSDGISFPVNINSGYAVSNLNLKHASDDKLLGIPRPYDFSVGGAQFWTPPSNIVSLATITSLPAPYQLVVNKTCRLRLTFDGTDDFHSSSYSALVASIEFSTNNGGFYTTVALSSANISIHVSNKTLDLDFTTTSAAEHLFRFVLKGEDLANTSYYTTSIPSNNIFSFPSIVSTNKLSPYDTTGITVGQTISMESNFSSAIDANISGSITIVDTGGRTPVAQMLYDNGKIEKINFDIYTQWFSTFLSDIPEINTVYIRTEPNIAEQRVHKRSRCGGDIPFSYLAKCHQYHESWLCKKRHTYNRWE
tara:strand:- start:860 stop:1846 length:987 start_codon:yes stop_codon:yes gene_type:complete